MKKLFKEILSDFKAGKNIEIYITLLISFVVAILGVFDKVTNNILSSAMLAALSVLLFNAVSYSHSEKNKEDMLLKKLQELTQDATYVMFTDEFQRSELKDMLRDAEKVYLWGVTLSVTLGVFEDILVEKIASGLEVKTLSISPNSLPVEMAVVRSDREASAEDIRFYLSRTKRKLGRIRKRSKNMSGTLEAKESIYFPPWTMIAINPHRDSGVMFVRLSSFETSGESRLSFLVSAYKHKKWFSFFINQFENVWDKAKVIDKLVD